MMKPRTFRHQWPLRWALISCFCFAWALAAEDPAAKMTEAARGEDLFRRGEWAAAVEAFDKAIAQTRRTPAPTWGAVAAN